MGKLLRTLGAGLGGVAQGYIGGQQADRNRREAEFYQKLGDLSKQADAMQVQQDEQRAQIGDRRPATDGMAAAGAVTPMLTQPAGDAPGPGAMQPAPPTPFVTSQPKPSAPQLPFVRTLSNAYGDLGS